MNKRIYAGLLLASVLLLGACGKKDSQAVSDAVVGKVSKEIIGTQTETPAAEEAPAEATPALEAAPAEEAGAPAEPVADEGPAPEISMPAPPERPTDATTGDADPATSQDAIANIASISTLDLLKKLEAAEGSFYLYIGRPSSEKGAAFKGVLEAAVSTGIPEGTQIFYLNTDTERNDEDFTNLLTALNVTGVPTLMKINDLVNFSFYSGGDNPDEVRAFFQQ